MNTGRQKCPCCEYFTVDSDDEVIVDICEVCFWQYDWIAHKYPERNTGANHISLLQAKQNYKRFGVCKQEMLHLVRPPNAEELPENNQTV